jgi:hypothetical protein
MTIITCTKNVFSVGINDNTSLVIIVYNDRLSIVSIDGTQFDLEEINY